MKAYKFEMTLRDSNPLFKNIFFCPCNISFRDFANVITRTLMWLGDREKSFYIEGPDNFEIIDMDNMNKTMGINFKTLDESIVSDFLDKNDKFVFLYGDPTPFIFDLKVLDIDYDGKNYPFLIEASNEHIIETSNGLLDYYKFLKNNDLDNSSKTFINKSFSLEEINDELSDFQFEE